MSAGGRPRILSDAQLDEMVALRERGWSHERIARHFTAGGAPIGASGISWQCLRLGADAPPRFRRRSPVSTAGHVRGGRPVRRWTIEEDAELLKLEASGMGPCAIGPKLGRANTSVRKRLLTLARIEARQEEELEA